MIRRITPGVIAALAFFWCAHGSPLLHGSGAGGALPQTPAGREQGGATERAGLQRTGVFQTKGPARPGRIAWESPELFVMKRGKSETTAPITMNTGGDVPFVFFGSNFFRSYPFDYSDPLVAGDTIYFSLYIGDGYLFAVDAKTGQSRWGLQRKKGYFSTPTVAGDVLYVGADGGIVHALDLKARNERWRFNSPGKARVMNAPSVTEETVFFGTYDGIFYALDSKAGGIKWSFKSGRPTQWLTPAFEGGTAFCGSAPGDLYALDTKTGNLVWKFAAKGGMTSVAASQGVLYLTGRDGGIIALDARTGERRPKARKEHKAGTLLAVSDGTLYFGGWHGGSVYAVDAGTGDVKWKFVTEEPCNSPVVADGAVFFTCEDKKLYAVDAKTGERLWAVETKDTQLSNPAIAEGTAYLIGDSGKVYAIR